MTNTSNSDIVDRAMRFDMAEVTRRFAKNEGLSEDIANEIERELKRFLALGALSPDTRYPMTSVVDPLWHEFLVFTRLYHRFCDELGRGFIHHEPRRHGDEPEEATKHRFDVFFSDYRTQFGEDAPRHIWPRFSDLRDRPDNCSTCHHHDCARCNTCD